MKHLIAAAALIAITFFSFAEDPGNQVEPYFFYLVAGKDGFNSMIANRKTVRFCYTYLGYPNGARPPSSNEAYDMCFNKYKPIILAHLNE